MTVNWAEEQYGRVMANCDWFIQDKAPWQKGERDLPAFIAQEDRVGRSRCRADRRLRRSGSRRAFAMGLESARIAAETPFGRLERRQDGRPRCRRGTPPGNARTAMKDRHETYEDNAAALSPSQGHQLHAGAPDDVIRTLFDGDDVYYIVPWTDERRSRFSVRSFDAPADVPGSR